MITRYGGLRETEERGWLTLRGLIGDGGLMADTPGVEEVTGAARPIREQIWARGCGERVGGTRLPQCHCVSKKVVPVGSEVARDLGCELLGAVLAGALDALS